MVKTKIHPAVYSGQAMLFKLPVGLGLVGLGLCLVFSWVAVKCSCERTSHCLQISIGLHDNVKCKYMRIQKDKSSTEQYYFANHSTNPEGGAHS